MPQGVELATGWVRVVPSFEGVQGNLQKGFAPAAKLAEAEGKKAGGLFSSGVGGAIKGLAVSLGGIFAAQKVIEGIRNTIDAASDLQEVGTAVGAIFGSSTTQVEKWAQGSARALGQSQLEALNAAKTFGIYGQAAGLAGEENVTFSTGLANLAGDLASFHNTSPEEAIIAIGAALRGENEPIRRFGVLLDDASLRQEALRQGLIATTSQALTPQQKVLAAHALILQQTSVAQGDFARTSGNLANQQRIASAQWTDISAKIGQLFLPAMTGAAQVTNTVFLPAISTAVDWLSGRFVPALQGVFDFLRSGNLTSLTEAFNVPVDSPIVGFLSALRDGFERVWAVIGPLAMQFIELWSTISPLSIIFQAIEPILPQLVDAFSSLATTLGGALSNVFATLLPIVAELAGVLAGVLSKAISAILPIIVQVVEMLGPILADVIGAILPLIENLAGVFRSLVQAVVPLIGAILPIIPPIVKLVGALLPPLVDLFSALLTPILALITPLVNLLAPILQFLVGIIATVITWIADAITAFLDWALAGVDLSGFMDEAMKVIGAVIQWLWENVIQPVFNAIGAIFTWLWETIIKPVVDFIVAYVQFWGQIYFWLWENVLQPIFNAIGAIFTWIWENIIQPIVDQIVVAVQAWGAIFNWLWTNVTEPTFNLIGEIFNWLWTNVIDPVIQFINGAIENWGLVVDTVGAGIAEVWNGLMTVFNTVRDVIAAAIQKVTDVINGVLQTFRDVAQGIRDAFDGIGQFIADAFGGIGDFIGGVAQTFNNLFGGVGDKGRAFKGKLQNIAAQRAAGMGPGIGAPGTALARVQSVLGAFPGLHITDTYSTPARDAMFGIVRSPNSYHYDANNPAVDVAGPIPMLWQFANWVYSVGGWRQILWQVAGHYDHVHVAHTGGQVSASWPRMPGDGPDERLARLQVGETILPVGVEPVRVTPFVPEHNDDDDPPVGFGPAVIIDGDVHTAELDEFLEKVERKRRRAYAQAGVSV